MSKFDEKRAAFLSNWNKKTINWETIYRDKDIGVEILKSTDNIIDKCYEINVGGKFYVSTKHGQAITRIIEQFRDEKGITLEAARRLINENIHFSNNTILDR